MDTNRNNTQTTPAHTHTPRNTHILLSTHTDTHFPHTSLHVTIPTHTDTHTNRDSGKERAGIGSLSLSLSPSPSHLHASTPFWGVRRAHPSFRRRNLPTRQSTEHTNTHNSEWKATAVSATLSLCLPPLWTEPLSTRHTRAHAPPLRALQPPHHHATGTNTRVIARRFDWCRRHLHHRPRPPGNRPRRHRSKRVSAARKATHGVVGTL